MESPKKLDSGEKYKAILLALSIVCLSICSIVDVFTIRDLRKRVEKLETDDGLIVNILEMVKDNQIHGK